MTTHIAEIYFRAWKKASGEFLEKIESLCIQDFMQNAIFLHRSSPVHSKVRQVDCKIKNLPVLKMFFSPHIHRMQCHSLLSLSHMQIVSYFHTRKDCRNVDKMLYNLYRPILWKALSVRVLHTGFILTFKQKKKVEYYSLIRKIHTFK